MANGAKPMEGSQSLTEMVRQSLGQKSREAAAAALGFNKRTFRLIKKLLLLKERNVLNPAEDIVVDQALQILEEGRGLVVKPAEDITKEIIALHWHKGSRNGKTRRYLQKGNREAAKAKMRFENTLFTIREACANNEGMTIPVLTEEEKREFKNSLVESISELWSLWHQLHKPKEKQDEQVGN